MNIVRCILFLSLACWASLGIAQVDNDECLIAQFIPDVSDFCSGEATLTNVGATASSDIAPGCWSSEDAQADVWFSFRPRNTGLLIRLLGQNPDGTNTLDNSAFTLYNGSCGNLTELICARIESGFDDVLERVTTDIVIGATYYIRVSSGFETAGSFELCINEFTAVPVPESDCRSSVVLCDESGFFIENLNSTGSDIGEIPPGACIQAESASAWYTWTAETSGSLTFVLEPTGPDPAEDIDFILFSLPDGLNNCTTKTIERCMASGQTRDQDSSPCFGPTGLREGSTDITEIGGCQDGDDNFLAPLDLVAGQSYGLLINNFSESGFGFTVEFGGTAKFLGPQPDFNITAQDGFECDKIITFSNLSTSATDQIVEYRWNFGDGATPQTAVGPGPHQVVYNTFGDKLSALTIVTDRGCEVTDISDITINPCCIDNSLTVEATLLAANCNGRSDAELQLIAGSGSPMYLYSFEGGPFLANDKFDNLPAGSYSFSAQDVKGCITMSQFDVIDPAPVTLDISAGMDTVALGDGTILTGTAGPSDRSFTYNWVPIPGLSCTDCPVPNVIPPGTTTYTLTATDQLGCDATADITIFTIDIKNFYAPNAMNPNSINSANSRFKIFGNISIQAVEFIEIFDRWGNMLYTERNLNINDPNYLGWDGMVDGQAVNPGVYIWIAKVIFIDGEIQNLAGDVTIFD